ncbi:MAG: glycoside hydrolase family 127 protein [Eubacteriales bacterium]|nr:glycoside hydrolase family 127 protein [Eubacteriales bacterium]
MKKTVENMYANYPADCPKLNTDKLFVNYDNKYFYKGFIDEGYNFIEDFQLLNSTLWRRFVQQFREDADYDAGWRGEYWGKMMRGACFVYSYTKNPQLYSVLTQTVRDMIDSADETGRISSYGVNHEFDAWDTWSRKYVLLGMEYFIEICNDGDFVKEIIQSMIGQVDYIISKIGDGEGKTPITKATRHWRGLNSSSLLEPVVRLYSITKEKRFLDFARYIVDCGGTDVENIFDLAYEGKMYPYQYPVTKAYEMTSCFEGLLEYYRITGNERYKTAIINYANMILESDFTVIGSSGCTHELFDHSTVRQANTTNGNIQQETCVTVTLMKFFYQLNLLTGDSKYVDAFERALYNGYLGAINTQMVIEPMIERDHPDWEVEPLPFDSYSPLTAGTRGNGIGGLKSMSDNHYYGCCACIGAAGIGLVSRINLPLTKDSLVVNLFIRGIVHTKTPNGRNLTLIFDTDYPANGKVKITIDSDVEEEFEMLVRNPEWSASTQIKVNNRDVDVCEGYIPIRHLWQKGDVVEIDFDMRTRVIRPIPYGSQILMNKVVWGANTIVPTYDSEDPLAHKHIALQRGPIMLAQDNRLGYSVDDAIDIKVDDGYVDLEILDTSIAPYKSIIFAKVPLTDGGHIAVTDYASAGKLWTEESKMAVWMYIK